MRTFPAASLAICLGFLAHGAEAQEASFYAGKTLSLYAGMPVGGGVDDEMRVVARHLGQFIPGKPSVIARNMPGAGGVVLGNYLRHNASADGLTLGMPTRSGFLLSNVVTQSGIKYDLADFSYIGGAGSNSVTLWLRKTAGITSIDDLLKSKKDIVVGGLAPRSQSALIPRVLDKYEGWPIKVVHGYPGFNEVLIAIERRTAPAAESACGPADRRTDQSAGHDHFGLPNCHLPEHQRRARPPAVVRSCYRPERQGAAGTSPNAKPDRPTAHGAPSDAS